MATLVFLLMFLSLHLQPLRPDVSLKVPWAFTKQLKPAANQVLCSRASLPSPP